MRNARARFAPGTTTYNLRLMLFEPSFRSSSGMRSRRSWPNQMGDHSSLAATIVCF
jgi:hypothetical protein